MSFHMVSKINKLIVLVEPTVLDDNRNIFGARGQAEAALLLVTNYNEPASPRYTCGPVNPSVYEWYRYVPARLPTSNS